jgi:hypothetical protein
MKSLAARQEKIAALFTDPFIGGFATAVIQTHPGDRVDVRVPYKQFVPTRLALEMLKFGLVLAEVQIVNNNAMQPLMPSSMWLSYKKIDCDVKLDCIADGQVIVKEKVWRLE